MNIQRRNLRVVDAKHGALIRVLPCDLKNSVCKDHQRCVIAQAIKRKYGAPFVDVGAVTVIIAKSKTRAVRYLLDNVAKDQVKHFDSGYGFSPCRVRLTPPPPTQRLGYRRGDKSSGRGRYKKKAHRSAPSR